jgi:hypothetical protein
VNLLEVISVFRTTYRCEGRAAAVKWVNSLGLHQAVIDAIVALYDRRLNKESVK